MICMNARSMTADWRGFLLIYGDLTLNVNPKQDTVEINRSDLT